MIFSLLAASALDLVGQRGDDFFPFGSVSAVKMLPIASPAFSSSTTSVESFIKTVSSTSSAELHEKLPQVLRIKDVRITPGYMHFDNAFEGKTFLRYLVIQNCGRNMVFVRLTNPSSRFESFPEGLKICPGQTITRKVKFTYRVALGVLAAFSTIWIDDEEMTYHFLVSLSKPVVSVVPQEIDFGIIDAVHHARTRSFLIKNLGCKGTLFAIDLGRNPLKLNVSPMKGALPANSSVPVTVEIVATKEGSFVDEFWIKTEPPLRVLVRVTFITPKFTIPHDVRKLDVALMDYAPTYYGSALTKTLAIRNISSSNGMFCIKAEVRGVIMDLDEAQKIDDNYRNFLIKPLDGRLQALKTSLIAVTFSPIKTRKKEKNYSMCFIKVIHMDCEDVTESVYNNNNFRGLPQVDSNIGDVDSIQSIETSISLSSEESERVNFNHSLEICLHGEKQTPGITFRPTELHLIDLTMEKLYEREVLITNTNRLLPIRVRYNKVASIDVRPPDFILPPDESIEVSVIVRTSKFDTVVKTVTFDLLSEDANVVKEVAKSHFRIQFDTTNLIPKPRLDTCALCKEVPEKLDPDYPYRQTKKEIENKIANKKNYIKYIRLTKPLKEDEDMKDYDMPETKLLQLKTKCKKPPSLTKPQEVLTPFIPLLPSLLHNIKIYPKSIRLQKVAAFTTTTNFFVIENQNDFPIRVFVKASKSCIVFGNDSRYIVNGMEAEKITFNFSTTSIGKYYVNISVLINDSTLFELTVAVQVVPKILQLETENIVFTEKDTDYKMFKVVNTLNSPIKFTWEVPHPDFKIYPISGVIQAERSLLSMIDFKSGTTGDNSVECTLASESGHTKVLNVTYPKRAHLIVFDNYIIDTGVIPLNIPIKKILVMKNLKKGHIFFKVENKSIPGIKVVPDEGKVNPLDSQVFVVTIHITVPVKFSTEINFTINDESPVTINLEGVAEYPSVTIRPSTLQFRKLAVHSFDTLAFKMKNLSKCETYISFPLHDEFPEFRVTESEDDRLLGLKEIVLPPEQGKVLFLHFHPQYVSKSTLILPFIMNGILGPTYINSSQSASPTFFLQEQLNIYKDVQGLTHAPLPRQLPVMRITFSASEEIISFSNLNMNFIYYGDNHESNVTSADFTILNCSNETIDICVRIDELNHPFLFVPKIPESVECHTVAYKATLDPEQQVVFRVDFFPTELGTYTLQLPIFLHHYYDNKIFNYVTMRGVYDQPSIIPSSTSLYFEPIPIQIHNHIEISLLLKKHFPQCSLSCDSSSNILVVFRNSYKLDNNESIQCVSVYLKSVRTKCLDSHLVFLCTCGAPCVISVTGVIENCLLTTHTYSYMLSGTTPGESVFKTPSRSSAVSLKHPRYIKSLVNENVTCFPLFPSDDDVTLYARYMRKIINSLENWLFSQGFYQKMYCKIPEGFIYFCKTNKPRVERTFGGFEKVAPPNLPIVQLMTSFVGPAFRQLIPQRMPEIKDDENTWLVYIYKCRCAALQNLRDLGAYLPHVKTKYLLSYEGYVAYEKNKHPNCTPMKESIFYRLCKQCWMDVILQMIKVFLLNSSVLLPESRVKVCVDKQESVGSNDDLGEDVLHVGIYGEREEILISWLQEHYDSAKMTLWEEEPDDKTIIYIDEDLSDGLVLAAVTAHYCPFFQEEIRDMYPRPRNLEERLHNVHTVVDVWTKLKFSYVIVPQSLLKSNMVEMLLLVIYLYNVLPTCTPSDNIIIEAPLTQRVKTKIDLKNLGDDLIRYELVFFGNKSNFFTVAADVVVVPPNKTKVVEVEYHAKTVQTYVATLLFSGETPGQKYGKNLVVTLTGTADVTYTCMEIPLTIDLYKPCQVTFNLESPFKVKAEYSVYFGSEQMSKERNVLFPWDEVQNLKSFKEYAVQTGVAEFDEEGKRVVTKTLCLQKMGPRNVWIYYRNPEVGDWGVKMTIEGQIDDSCYENIDVVIPDDYETLGCTCKKKKSVAKKCPKILHAKIPMMNNLLWTARKKMVLLNLNPQGMEFWQDRIFTPLGTRILKLIVDSETHPLRQIIEDEVEYMTRIEPSSFVTQRSVAFEDVTSDDFYDLPIHPLTNKKIKKATLILTSVDQVEKRYYKLYFLRE